MLIMNAGSSSIKFAVFHSREEEAEWRGQVEGLGGSSPVLTVKARGSDKPTSHSLADADHEAAIKALLGWLEDNVGHSALKAAGHRVVHGGQQYAEPVRIDEKVLDTLETFSDLAPLHQPHNLSPIRQLMRLRPELPQVACFDTAFHRDQPWIAQQFALPREWTEKGVLRYGFHGLSYDGISRQLRQAYPSLAAGRVVVAHLGNGASLCGMRDGKSQATSMGFTALDGLPMGQRCGALDPGVVLWLIQQQGLSAEEVQEMLYKHSGLLGVSGISHDMRDLIQSASPAAKEAMALFAYRTAREIGSLVTALGGIDGLVFTAGIGEHCPEIRRAIVEQLSWLGFELDKEANQGNAEYLSRPETLPILVLPTDEESVIARNTRKLLALG
nr:acetate/propionate family kinase [Natronospira proteinivora]